MFENVVKGKGFSKYIDYLGLIKELFIFVKCLDLLNKEVIVF